MPCTRPSVADVRILLASIVIKCLTKVGVMSSIASTRGLVGVLVPFFVEHTFAIDCPFLFPTIFLALPNSMREEKFGNRFVVTDFWEHVETQRHVVPCMLSSMHVRAEVPLRLTSKLLSLRIE